MNNYFIIPGLGNSGSAHWQTWLEKNGSGFRRIQQKEWDAPDCNTWTSTIEKTVIPFNPENVILIGHSLGCATIAHWAATYRRKIRGALLVAPSDLESPVYQFPNTGFDPFPIAPIPFKTIVVASSNDPWVSIERAKYFARNWGSELVEIGPAGHINADSGHGPWPECLDLIKKLEL